MKKKKNNPSTGILPSFTEMFAKFVTALSDINQSLIQIRIVQQSIQEHLVERSELIEREKAAFLKGVKGELFKAVPGLEKNCQKLGEHLRKEGILPPINITHISRKPVKRKGKIVTIDGRKRKII